MGYCNEILRANNDAEHREFIKKIQAARDDIVAFVNDLLGWGGAGQYHCWLKGSFNIGYVIKYSGGDDSSPGAVFIRFPIPGRTYSKWSAEKVKNEVMVLEYLLEHTTIPVPRVLFWGPAENCPRELAPFILMEFMDGVCLDDLLKKPGSDQDPLILDPDVDQAKLEVIYSQIADYILQLSRLQFPNIGAISKDSGRWDITRRPMTYDMNDLVAETGFPAYKLPSRPFNRASEYFRQRATELWTHLYTQPNICETEEETRQRFTARRRLAQLIPKYCIDDDNSPSFRLFGDDFGPFNMLADPKTLQITAVLDFEFTNAMPAQYIQDVPSWLLLASPHCWLERDDKAGFEKLFVPQMELFIREVERAEALFPPLNRDNKPLDGDKPLPCLSAQMRDSWRSGRFWFNYAMRTSIDADVVYWKALDDGKGGEMSFAEKEMEQFVKTKMEQFDAYLKEKENDPRFE